jgi:hypothetical protein
MQDHAAAATTQAQTATATPLSTSGILVWITFNSGDGASQSSQSPATETFAQSSASLRPAVGSGIATFDGGDQLNSATNNLANGATNGTFGAWFYATGTFTGYRAVFRTYTSGSYNQSIAMFDSYKPFCVLNSTIRTNGAAVAESEWTHNVLTFDKNPSTGRARFTAYVNGVAYATAVDSAAHQLNVSDFWRIGSEDSARRWVGGIDDVRLYTRQLSAAEVKQWYDRSLVGGVYQPTNETQR